MKKKEINLIYEYFKNLNNVELLEKEIKRILQNYTGIRMNYRFALSNVVKLDKHYDSKNKNYYLFDEYELAYQQENYFIWQHTLYEDNFYGCIYFLLEENKYLKIEYSC